MGQSYDNLSGLKQEVSNRICRISTGGALSFRKLYSNDEEQIFNFRRPVMLNGIGSVAEKPDLAERSIALRLPRITPDRRKTEKALNAEFEAMRPALIGALLSGVAGGLERLPHTEQPDLPRMADFGQFAIACEEALGMEAGAFMAAHDDSSTALIAATLEGDPVATALLAYLKKNTFEGTASDLDDALQESAGYGKDGNKRKPREWPGNASALSRRISTLAPSLRAVGIVVDRSRDSDKGRGKTITLKRVGEVSEKMPSVASVASDEDDKRPTRAGNGESTSDGISDGIALADGIQNATDGIGNLIPSEQNSLNGSNNADSDGMDGMDGISERLSPTTAPEPTGDEAAMTVEDFEREIDSYSPDGEGL